MRELIYIVIESFYKKATTDILIGYHFAHFNDPGTLEPHLERITTFWEMQFTGQITKPLEGKGFQLMFTHLQLGIKKGELGRWVMLFHQTLAELETEFEKQAPEELENIKKLNEEWKKRIDFFKTRFESHPQMFRQQ